MRSALFPLGRHDDWADHIRAAESLANEMNDTASLARAYNYLCSHHWIHGRHQEAIALGEKNLQLAQSIGDFSVEVTSKFHLGIPFLYTGNIDRQVALHREVALQLSGPTALKRHGLSSVPAITARGYLAWGLAELGNFDEAGVWAQEALELSGRVRNHFSTGFAQACIGLAYLRSGEVDTALKLLLKANTMGRESDLKSIYTFVAGSLGEAYLISGEPDKALPILFEAIDRRYFDSSVIPPLYTITVLAEAYRQLGQLDMAVKTSEKALKIFHKNQERSFGAWTLYVAARIQSDNTQEQVANQSLIQATDLASAIGMRPLLAHCYLELGKLSSRLRNEDAQEIIQKAIALYRSLDMSFWLREAEELLLHNS
jgi:tetratricopeptide (TPR) repeat protein